MTSTAELNRDYDLTGVPAIVAGSVKLGLLEGIAYFVLPGLDGCSAGGWRPSSAGLS